MERRLLEGVSRRGKQLGQEPGARKGEFQGMAFLDGQMLQPPHLELPGVCSCPRVGQDLRMGLASLTWFSSPQPPGGGVDERPDPGSALLGYIQLVPK